MQAAEYATLYGVEETYWWFTGLRRILGRLLEAHGVATGARILDAGCGTGETIRELARRFRARPAGFDYSPHAAPFWRLRELDRVCRASINDLPFADASFDAVLSVDVLECDGVDERRAYGELWRVARPGGLILLVVPAYRWMMTESHHRAVGASRRYSRGLLRKLLETRPVRLLRLTHLFAGVFPAVAALRVAARCLLGNPAEARSELSPLPGPLNRVLDAVMQAEAAVVERVDLPVGSSILAVVRRASP
jgi:SAM-dependent methyltransferase